MKRYLTAILLACLIAATMVLLLVNRLGHDRTVEYHTCTRCRLLKRIDTRQLDKQITTTHIDHPNPHLAKQVCPNETAHRWTHGANFYFKDGFGRTQGAGSRDASAIWHVPLADQMGFYERCETPQALRKAIQHFERYSELPLGSPDEREHFEKSRRLIQTEVVTESSLD